MHVTPQRRGEPRGQHPPDKGKLRAPEGPLRRAPARRAEDRANDMGRDEDDVVWVSLGGSLFSDWTQPIDPCDDIQALFHT